MDSDVWPDAPRYPGKEDRPDHGVGGGGWFVELLKRRYDNYHITLMLYGRDVPIPVNLEQVRHGIACGSERQEERTTHGD